MSLTYITKCDGCKIRAEGWNDCDDGWAEVNYHAGVDDKRLDFCPDCWKKMAHAVELQYNVGGILV